MKKTCVSIEKCAERHLDENKRFAIEIEKLKERIQELELDIYDLKRGTSFEDN